jgi:hypothetical protein
MNKTKNDLNDLVYYVSYGSNLKQERFYKYIEGGAIKGNERIYKGCRDKTLPKENITLKLKGEVIFAEKTQVWEPKGSGLMFFIENQEYTSLGRGYLVTRQQFIDILAQENSLRVEELTESVEEIFSTNIKNSGINLKQHGNYSKIVRLDDHKNVPAYTFTTSKKLEEIELNPPGQLYFQTLLEGLLEMNIGSREYCINYLQNLRGYR